MTIKLEVNTKEVAAELADWMGGIQEIVNPSVLTEIAKATFAITSKRFMIDIDNYARRNPKKMHHIYEWGGIGKPQSRLFVLERTSMLYGDLTISTKFLSSKLPVPISPELLKPGPTGKVVSKKNIFKNKAEVMESGTPVSFSAKRVLAFMGNNGIAFISPGTQVNILHPGGIATKNSFASYMLEWYTKNASIIMDSSGFYESMANDVAIALNESNGKGSISAVRSAVANLANKIDTGAVVK